MSPQLDLELFWRHGDNVDENKLVVKFDGQTVIEAISGLSSYIIWESSDPLHFLKKVWK